MSNAIGRSTAVAFVAESTYGTTPTTPSLVAINVEPGLTFGRDQNYFEDTSVRSDRNRTGTFRGNYVVRGSFSQVLRPVEMDTFLESLMQSTWSSNTLKNGSTRKGLTIERAWTDIPLYQSFSGCQVDSAKFDISNSGLVKTTWNLIGLASSLPTGTSLDADGYTAQSTAVPFGEADAVITEGGSTLAYCTNISLDLSNSLEPLTVIGQQSTYDLVAGVFKASGTMKALFPSAALYNKFANGTATSLSVTLTSGAHTYVIDLPNVTFTKADVPANDGVIEVDITFEAYYDAGSAAAITITRT